MYKSFYTKLTDKMSELCSRHLGEPKCLDSEMNNNI
jgi:hypothetical protein